MVLMDLQIILAIIFGAIGVILLCILLWILSKNRKPRGSKVIVDDEYIERLIQYLGGYQNILDYSVENARVKFVVSNVNTVDLEKLKELSPSGVFVTGNRIKTLFKYESKDIISMLDSKLK